MSRTAIGLTLFTGAQIGHHRIPRVFIHGADGAQGSFKWEVLLDLELELF